VRHDAVGRARLRVHRDEERSVTALLEKLRVLRPVVLHHVLARGIELVGNKRVEGPLAARAMTVHDDDLLRPSGLRPTHRRVDLLRIEITSLVVGALLLRSVRLLPLDDSGDAFHVAEDEDLHEPASVPTATATGVLQGKLIQRSVRRQTKSQRTTLCGFS
jgi:hypothetical protein